MDKSIFLVKHESGEMIKIDVPLNSKISIGRESVNDIVLDDMTVSRVHCTILNDSDKLYLRDEKSTNGTSVNDHVLSPNEVVELHHGDAIRMARCLFVFQTIVER